MNKKTHNDRSHALLPPSSSSRWINCAPSMAYVKSLIESKKIVKRESGRAAKRGTRIHEYGESFIRWKLAGKKTSSIIGDENEIQVAREYADYCINLYENALFLDPKAVCGVEDTAVLDSGHCWGSRDFWVYGAGRLTIVDLKTGADPVEPKDNTQLLIYAIDKFEELQADEVEVVIWQPSNWNTPDRSHVYTKAEMIKHARRLREHATNSASWFNKPIKKIEPELVSGDWCDWCDAFAVCPAARKKNSEIGKTAFAPAVIQSSPVKMPEASELKPAQVSEILSRAPTFISWIDAVKTHALQMMQKGITIPGFKPVAKNTRYAWEKTATAAKIAKAAGLKISDITETRLMSYSKVKQKTKPSNRSKLDVLKWRPFETVIAKESDRRMAIPSTKISFQPVSHNEEDDDE